MIGGGIGVGLAALLFNRKLKDTYEQCVPLQYQYRPGTISGWLANMLSRHSKTRRKQRPVRVYMDGCFDMMHYGHANALRQAKSLGDQLVVGLIPDSEILRCKGPPVLNEDERYALVSSVKWVDEVISGVPYDLSPEFIQELFTKHKIDYIIHGDDPCLLPDGTDAYAHAKRLGRFCMIKRTEGVSTTDIVGRMLTCTRVNPFVQDQPHPLAQCFSLGEDQEEIQRRRSLEPGDGEHGNQGDGDVVPREVQHTTLSRFLPTSRRLVQFSNSRVAPEGARIVYIDGAFDAFHPGHVKILEAAKAQGNFLLVGLHTDEDVQERRGPHLPIMNLHERSLSVLACKYVDEVVIGSPTIITQDLITTFNISLVVRGTMSEMSDYSQPQLQSHGHGSIGNGMHPVPSSGSNGPALGMHRVPSSSSNGNGNGNGTRAPVTKEERYAVPRALGVYCELPSPTDLSARNIIQRIVSKRQAFEARNEKKTKSEATYYQAKKEYVQEL
uniref:ethanolamine-phosphate cytidylyltransferase n=1 Tax=Dunaliella tertiolecta TaxID=3047 RepID=A0A7S3R010_DUNTE